MIIFLSDLDIYEILFDHLHSHPTGVSADEQIRFVQNEYFVRRSQNTVVTVSEKDKAYFYECDEQS